MSENTAASWTLLPVEGPPKELQHCTSVEHGLTGAVKHFKARSTTGAKDRTDLAALQKHTGEKYAQVEAVPDAVFNRLREQLQGVSPYVLLPPSRFSPLGIVLFADAHAALKGLPANKRGTMLLNACGLKDRGEIRGDCMIGQLVLTESGAPALGGNFTPAKIAQRDWLEAAQKEHVGGQNAEAAKMEGALGTMLEKMRREEVAKALAAKTAAPPPASAPPPPQKPEAVVASGKDHSEAAALDVSDPSAAATAPSTAEGKGGYTWEDKTELIEVAVPVPSGTKAKHVKVAFKDAHLKIEVLTLPAGKTVVVDGALFQEVKAGDCNWSLEDDSKATDGSRVLNLTLEKKDAYQGKNVRWLMLMRDGDGVI